MAMCGWVGEGSSFTNTILGILTIFIFCAGLCFVIVIRGQSVVQLFCGRIVK